MTPLHLRFAFTEWPPYTSAALPGGGVLTTIFAESVAADHGRIEWEELAWNEALARTFDGEFDAAFPGYFSAERAERYLLSAPLLGGELCLFSRDDEPPTAVGHGVDVAVTEGYVNCPAIDADPAITRVGVADDVTGLEMLLDGSVHAVAMDHFVGRYHLRHSVRAHLRGARVLERSLGRFGLHALFSRERADAARTVSAFDSALRRAGAQRALTDALRCFDLP